MKIIIGGWKTASEFVPENPTYAIRIWSSFNIFKYPLVKSNLYQKINEYYFDDVSPITINYHEGPRTMINQNIATKIVNDFNNGRKDCSTLFVHCSQGKNRSPAVAMALNDIFSLGQDTDELRKKYSEYNRYVYKFIKETAKDLLLKP